MDDLVKRLRGWPPSVAHNVMQDAADRIEALESRIAKADALAEALEAMLSHSCVADAGYDMKDAEDHAAERLARIALAAYREGSDT